MVTAGSPTREVYLRNEEVDANHGEISEGGNLSTKRSGVCHTSVLGEVHTNSRAWDRRVYPDVDTDEEHGD